MRKTKLTQAVATGSENPFSEADFAELEEAARSFSERGMPNRERAPSSTADPTPGAVRRPRFRHDRR